MYDFSCFLVVILFIMESKKTNKILAIIPYITSIRTNLLIQGAIQHNFGQMKGVIHNWNAVYKTKTVESFIELC